MTEFAEECDHWSIFLENGEYSTVEQYDIISVKFLTAFHITQGMRYDLFENIRTFPKSLAFLTFITPDVYEALVRIMVKLLNTALATALALKNGTSGASESKMTELWRVFDDLAMNVDARYQRAVWANEQHERNSMWIEAQDHRLHDLRF